MDIGNTYNGNILAQNINQLSVSFAFPVRPKKIEKLSGSHERFKVQFFVWYMLNGKILEIKNPIKNKLQISAI